VVSLSFRYDSSFVLGLARVAGALSVLLLLYHTALLVIYGLPFRTEMAYPFGIAGLLAYIGLLAATVGRCLRNLERQVSSIGGVTSGDTNVSFRERCVLQPDR